ncbi:hypothetical protein ACP70R_035492 [Stipagrostis hirtigluma subsp. patula]
MPARPWLLLLCLAAVTAAARGQQPDSTDFISIDCGLAGTTSYVDSATNLLYVADDGYTDAGVSYNIADDAITQGLPRLCHSVRSFPQGARNCYTLRPRVAGLKYLLRASFMYGDYDGLKTPPAFDLYVGVNFWTTVDVSENPDAWVFLEAIVFVPDSFVYVCLVNTGSGTPFISGLELRPLKNSLYPQANATQGLVLFSRFNIGPADKTLVVRAYGTDSIKPVYLYADAIYSRNPYVNVGHSSTPINISINATANSTLPPIINAVEVFYVISTSGDATDSHDGGSRNMSLSGLSGNISPLFAYLKSAEYLDLSHNNLTGSIPDALLQLPSLTFLDVTGNQLNGSIPPGLLKKSQDGSLKLRYGNNPNLCTDGNSCQTVKGKGRQAIYVALLIALAVVIVSLLVLLFFLLIRRKRQGFVNNSVKLGNETPSSHVSTGDGYAPSSLRLENRRFTYKELEMITNNFQHVIGRGGFGHVYNGFLEDGTQVAVKLRSQSSNQGVKEFLTEAQILTRIHHKNLVTMIGYCKDGEYMALVYEYMAEGTLQEHIEGKQLTWRQRLRIALESAQGLEYLHKGCNPPLIHRDVKTTNILLNARLEAKVADFGLSRAFNRDIYTHVSTNTLVGTPGYVDPEYQATMQPSTKSDVYAFGVVLLELITGKPAILRDLAPACSVIQWARQRLARGDIEGVARGGHDVNGVWKAAELALRCTARASAQRPTMADVVAQLQECLDLEEGRGGGGGGDDDATGSFYTGSGSGDLSSGHNYNAHAADHSGDVSQKGTAFEMERDSWRVPTVATGPDLR